MAYNSKYQGRSRTYTKRNLSERSQFFTRVYGHFFAAILGVVAIEVFMFRSGLAEPIGKKMLSVSWLLILGAFVLLGWLARRVAFRERSLTAQYAGLILYVSAKSIILIPLLYLAENFAPGAIASAGGITAVGFLGLTAIGFYTRKDFTFMRSFLYWAGFIAFVLIIVAISTKMRLGTWFDLGMIALAGTSILYDTSKIMYRYGDDRYVAAALDLFATVAMMFWYALRLFRRLGSRG